VRKENEYYMKHVIEYYMEHVTEYYMKHVTEYYMKHVTESLPVRELVYCWRVHILKNAEIKDCL